MTWAWGLLAAAALLWPDRVAGPLDGVPLDRALEVLLTAVAFPVLWRLHPRFLTTALARTCIAALIVWRLLSTIALGQEGWCVRFEPSRPYVIEQAGAPHAWDLRADWRAPDPACSAIMTRPYHTFADFPAWFFNLPPDSESWPGPLDRPPGATVRMTVRGYLIAPAAGTLLIDRSDDVRATVSVDGGADSGAPLAPGIHQIAIDATLTGEQWRFEPRWNGGDLWAHATTTVRRPTMPDRIVRPLARLVPSALIGILLASWAVAAAGRVRDGAALVWCAAASSVLTLLAAVDRPGAARIAVAGLALGAALPLPRRLQNLRGAFVIVGVPWLAYVAASALPAVGHFVLYDWGHDYWMFQRFAYRIVMQGHWVEGGSATFWFQPLYRWIAGGLHMIFGDSSAGEWFWDAACLLAGAMFSYRVARESAGHRWGIVAAVLPLGIFVLGTPQYLIGRGLGEISSMGFVSAAGLFALRSRHGRVPASVAAGLLATLAFYTRLNNLPMAAGVAAMALNPRAALRSRRRSPFIIGGIVALGMLAFAWRNWYFTGVFSLFYGTQKDLLAIWQPGMSIGTLLQRVAESVSMVLTVNDPPRFDVFAVPVLFGAFVALANLARLPGFTRIPAYASVFFLSAISGAFVARGSAYPGRFSMHVLPITSALAVLGAASVLDGITQARHRSAARSPSTPATSRSSEATRSP